jgi:hypothetical protein
MPEQNFFLIAPNFNLFISPLEKKKLEILNQKMTNIRNLSIRMREFQKNSRPTCDDILETVDDWSLCLCEIDLKKADSSMNRIDTTNFLLTEENFVDHFLRAKFDSFRYNHRRHKSVLQTWMNPFKGLVQF